MVLCAHRDVRKSGEKRLYQAPLAETGEGVVKGERLRLPIDINAQEHSTPLAFSFIDLRREMHLEARRVD